MAAAVVSILLAALLTYSAYCKLTRQPAMVESVNRVGFPDDKLGLLALILLAGAAGLVLGLVWAPIGVAAATGVLAYFAVTIAYHLRADDARNAPKPLAIAVVAAVALILRLTSL